MAIDPFQADARMRMMLDEQQEVDRMAHPFDEFSNGELRRAATLLRLLQKWSIGELLRGPVDKGVAIMKPTRRITGNPKLDVSVKPIDTVPHMVHFENRADALIWSMANVIRDLEEQS